MIKQEKQIPYKLLPFIVLIIAICFLIDLLTTIKTDVFFSGDGGLKYLMVGQISHGGNYYALNINRPLWVSEIWSRGYFPLKAPFIYEAPDGKIISFPPAFQWLNAAFYKWFGYRGIYIIPSISLVGLWILFIAILRRAEVKPLVISIGLLFMALGSPLTVYGAVYWEHTLAILLIFSAVVFLLTPRASYAKAVTAGVLSGMSVWFRPEMLVFCLLFTVMVLYNNSRNKNKVLLVFIISMLTAIAAFFLFNAITYGDSLGAHSYQLANTKGFSAWLGEKFIILTHINSRLVIFFPVIVLLYVLAIYILLKKILVPIVVVQLTVIIILFSFITPFLLPNAGGKQWGPRYFLPLIPLVLTILCLASNDFNLNDFTKKKWLLLLVPVLIYSTYLNMYAAHKYLRDDYSYRVKPGLDFLRNDTCEILVVQNQYITQEFAALFEKKKLFLAGDQRDFNELRQLLKAAGVSRIIYICSDSKHIMQPHNLINNNKELVQVGSYFFAEYSLE